MLKKKLIVLVVLLVGLLTCVLLIGCHGAECSHEFGKFTSAGADGHVAECSKCGEKKTEAHTFGEGYKSNENYHWHECTVCNEKDNQVRHTFNADGICEICAYSKGLQFEAVTVNGEQAYYVTGMGESTDTYLIIPDTYLGKPIVGIAERAFYYYTSLKSVTMPATVTYIGSYAFQGCSGLEQIYFSSAVNYIGDGAFQGCVKLPFVEENNAKYLGSSKKDNSGKYEIDEAHFALIEASDINIDTCSINDSTKIIAGGAFKGCAELLEITVPNSVINIGKWAFNGCVRLTSVKLGSSVATISEGAFQNCVNLTNITIPNSVKTIENSAFLLCYKLIEIVNLSDLDIKANPDSTANGAIGKYAKNICKAASESKITTDNNGYTFYNSDNEAYLLAYVGSESHLELPANFDGKAYALSDYAFYMNSDIVKIDLAGATSIGANAFDGCYNLLSVTVSNVTEIKDNAFNGCHKLVEIYNSSALQIEAGSSDNGAIAANALDVYTGEEESKLFEEGSYIFYKGDVVYLLGHIGDEEELVLNNENEEAYAIYDYAFYNNTSFEKVTIESGVTAIGKFAFANSIVTEVNLSGNIDIQDTSFENCNITEATIPAYAAAFVKSNHLTTVVITSGALENKALKNAKGLVSVTLNDGVTAIGDEAFSNCASLKTLILPDSIVYVGNSAFSGCSALTYNEETVEKDVKAKYLGNEQNPNMILIEIADKDLKTYTINANTKFIYSGAFQESALESISVPDGVLTIGSNAFTDCKALATVTLPESITYIGDSAFQDCSALTAIAIPGKVEVIHNSAFYKCTALETVTIPASVKEIKNGAFQECSKLTTISIESVEIIENNAFAKCTELTTVSIGDNIKSIGAGVFDACGKLTYTEEGDAKYLGNTANPYVILFEATNSELTSFTVKEGTRIIYNGAFQGYEKLTSITLGANVTAIGDDAFNGCIGLTALVIPANVTTIGTNAFRSCSEIKTITIGSKIAHIGKEAFRNCSKAESITFDGTRAEWDAVEKEENWNYNNIKVICSDDATVTE